MISLKELNIHNYPTTPEIDANLNTLLERINIIRKEYNTPMIVTSGLRSNEQQNELIKQGKSNAYKSKHLSGEAVDILDDNGEVKKFLLKNPDILETACLWCEAFNYTPDWVHFQIVPPASGRRFFIP